MDLSIVIVNWNTRDLLLACLASVFDTVNARFEVFLVDNASTDGSAAAVAERYPSVRILQNRENLGFAAANNRAFSRMGGRYAVLLNTDAVLLPGALDRLLAFMDRTPGAAMACGQLLHPDGRLQNAVANFPTLASLLFNEALLQLLFPDRFPSKRRVIAAPVRIDSCIGACMIVRAAAMAQVGRLDEGYFFFMEETDWARRMHRAGWDVYFVPEARIIHAQGQSVGPGLASRMLFYRSRYRYFRKWYPRTYRLYFAAVFGRLLVNAVANMVGVTVTAGRLPKLNARFALYRGLVHWHRNGCPDARPVLERTRHAG